MKAYLEELRRQRDAALPMEKRAANLLGKIREARGHQTGGDATYIPVPLTLASMGGGTANYPATKPYTEKVLLPNAAVSPTIGFGMGGLQARIKVDRRPDGVCFGYPRPVRSGTLGPRPAGAAPHRTA